MRLARFGWDRGPRSRAGLVFALVGLTALAGTSLALALNERTYGGLQCPPDTRYGAIVTYDVSEGTAKTPDEAVATFIDDRGAAVLGGEVDKEGTEQLIRDASSDDLVWLYSVQGQTRARIEVVRFEDGSYAVAGLVRCD